MSEDLYDWSALEELNDDTLFHIFSFLLVRDILTLRQTSRRIAAISRQRTVWHHAYIAHVLFQGLPLPFPHSRFHSLSAAELEYTVRRSLRIARFWSSKDAKPTRISTFRASEATTVADVKLLPGRGGRYVVTVTKGIWSVITCWDVGVGFNVSNSSSTTVPHVARKVAEWCPKGAIFNGFVVNSDSSSDGVLAISVNTGGQEIVILGIDLQPAEASEKQSSPVFYKVGTVNTTYRPITLDGSLIAFSNESNETVIMNWKTGAASLLCSVDDEQGFRYNRCLQVLFVHPSHCIIVVRARTLELFPIPYLSIPISNNPTNIKNNARAVFHPLARHSFGCLDGVAITPQFGPVLEFDSDKTMDGTVPPLSILVRKESDDPWTADVHHVEMYVLQPDTAFVPIMSPSFTGLHTSSSPSFASSAPSFPVAPSEMGTEHQEESQVLRFGCPRPPSSPVSSVRDFLSPYIFPPTPTPYCTPTPRGLLRNRCTDIYLGPCGSALWVQPSLSRTNSSQNSTWGSEWDEYNAGASADFGLTAWDVHASRTQGPRRFSDEENGKNGERLVGRLFGGHGMCTSSAVEESEKDTLRVFWMSEHDGPMSAVDYEEGAGRVVLGEAGGWVSILDLIA